MTRCDMLVTRLRPQAKTRQSLIEYSANRFQPESQQHGFDSTFSHYETALLVESKKCVSVEKLIHKLRAKIDSPLTSDRSP